jgi:2-polyprenyl-3-methyl-5-hydroxy-6-metoxy-1,4-benzoquinol methylase
MTENVVGAYGWSSSRDPGSCGYIAPKIIDLLHQLTIRRVLDLGAGNGALCAEISAGGWDVVGVEYDRDGVQIARSTHPNIRFYNYGVQDNPEELLQSEPLVDAVVSTEVIEHLFSPHLLPRYARGVLKPGGYLIVSTPYHGYLKNLALSLFGKWDKHFTALWHGGHIKFWSRWTLGELLKTEGFEVTAFHGVGRFPFLWKSMILVARLPEQGKVVGLKAA